MYGKLALSFATAALILAAGGFLVVSKQVKELGGSHAAATDAPTGRPPGVVPADPGSSDREPKDRIDSLLLQLEELSTDSYDYYSDLSNDLFALKREVRHLKNTLRQIVQGLGAGPGGVPRVGWGLVAKKAPLGGEVIQAYAKAAEEFDIQVEPGRVTVRGFLNLAPNTNMPIEYYITRFPESSHETLVHLIGNRELGDLAENPYMGLKGLATALYKALIAAGFEEGEPMHPDPDSPDRRNPRWILGTGETVYVGVRYELDGKTHVARATDWVIDPIAESVLAPDCFRFTGSARAEDPDTGDEVLRAELQGLLISVWPTSAALVEVALESARRNDFTYNFARIPKPDGEEVLYLDVILSKTPIETAGDGAKPLLRPPAEDTGLQDR